MAWLKIFANAKLNAQKKSNQIRTFYHTLVPGYPVVPNYFMGDIQHILLHFIA